MNCAVKNKQQVLEQINYAVIRNRDMNYYHVYRYMDVLSALCACKQHSVKVHVNAVSRLKLKSVLFAGQAKPAQSAPVPESRPPLQPQNRNERKCLFLFWVQCMQRTENFSVVCGNALCQKWPLDGSISLSLSVLADMQIHRAQVILSAWLRNVPLNKLLLLCGSLFNCLAEVHPQ